MKQIRFGEVAEFRNGLNFGKDSQGKGCLLIGIPDFKDRFSPDYNSLGEINPLGIIKEDDYLEKEDILFVRSNGNKNLVGRSLYIDRDVKAVYSGFCIRARLTSSIVDTLYCAYYTRSDRFRSSISSSGGTNIQNLNQGILSDVKIPLFSVKTQKQIAKVLSDLDAKIEVNNKINAELEAMAKLIYDYWFVQFDFPFDFAQGKPDPKGKPYKSSGGKMVYNKELKREIPEGWEVKTIGDYCKSTGGYAFKSSWWSTEGSAVVKIKDIQEDYTIDLTDISHADLTGKDIDAKFISKPGDVLIAMTGATVGKYAIVPVSKRPLYVNQRVGYFDLGNNPTSRLPFLINSLNQKYFREVVFTLASGAAQPNISNEQINNIKLVLPNDHLIEIYNYKMKSFYDKILNNQNENQKLSYLRDWLLPMLMNGQVTVANEELGITNAELGNDLGMIAEETQEYKYTK
tara:strand:+ start:871 stop:2244 length:1374 start_codon:yes stop_codon:yes gene_type:complete